MRPPYAWPGGVARPPWWPSWNLRLGAWLELPVRGESRRKGKALDSTHLRGEAAVFNFCGCKSECGCQHEAI